MSSQILRCELRSAGKLFLAAMLLAQGVAGRVFALSPEALQTMVIVSGDEGRGSGFLVKMDGKTYVITNSHVVRGNKNLKFKNLSNQELTVGTLEIADHADLVRAEVTTAVSALTMVEKAEQNLQIGNDVLVAGNSEGEGVVREIPGKLLGLGPDRIEVSAPFVPGNSGSPILLQSTGQVIGVATYLKIPRSLRGSKSATSLNEVRRFGFRIDTVGKWIHPDPPERIMREGMKLEELEQTMAVVVSILNSGTSNLTRQGSGAYISKARIASNPGLARLAAAVDSFVAASQFAKGDSTRNRDNVVSLFNALKTATVEDIRGYKEEHFSGYFADQFKEQLEERRSLYEYLDKTVVEASKNPQILSRPVGK